MRFRFLIIAWMIYGFAAGQAGPDRHPTPTLSAPMVAESVQPFGASVNAYASQAINACLARPDYGPNWLRAWEWTARINPFSERAARLESLFQLMDSLAGPSAEVALIRYQQTHDRRFFEQARELAGEADWFLPYRIREAALHDDSALNGLLTTYRLSHPLSDFRSWYFESVLRSAPQGAVLKVKGVGELLPLLLMHNLKWVRGDVRIEPIDTVCSCVGDFLTLGTPMDLREQFQELEIDGLLLRIADRPNLRDMINRMEQIDWKALNTLQPATQAEGSLYGNFLPSLKLIVAQLQFDHDPRLSVWEERLNRSTAAYQTYR